MNSLPPVGIMADMTSKGVLGMMFGESMVGVAMVSLAACWLLSGCQMAPTFPARPLVQSPQRTDYDVDGDGKADFFCFSDAAGRFDRIAYDRSGAGRPDGIVNLDAIDPKLCRHLVLVLDGFPYDVVKEFHDQGHLRFLAPPAVVIPPYPVMTDLALEDAFGYMPCEGYEAKYFDGQANRMAGGTREYLAGRNEPFRQLIQYRAGTLTDALAYLRPRPEFEKEIRAVKGLWDKRQSQEMIAYLVSSAGMGSRLGKAGQLEALARCEQLINQVYYESGGLVKVTLLADHGQTNIPCKSANLDGYLRGKGWRPAESLSRDDDVVLVKYGLVTSAALWTGRPAKLAQDLIACDKVALASYVEGDAVVVLGPGQAKATIRSSDGKKFEYRPIQGDPLRLGALGSTGVPPVKGSTGVSPVRLGSTGVPPVPSRDTGQTPVVLDGREVFLATSDGKHEYPDPLYRLWRAHLGLVHCPADVLVSLDDRYYNGSDKFAGFVSMASTHGGLNWRNSAAFIMSSAGPISGPLRSQDIPAVMEKLFSRPWPAGR